MKKVLSIFLSVLLILSIVPAVYGQNATETQISFDLTSKGEHTVTVPTGTEITVTYALNNKTTDAPFDVTSITNEIFFDHTFFEIDESSIEKVYNQFASVQDKSWGEYRVYFNDFHHPAKTYENGQVVGRFKLKVIATSGQSTLSSKQMTLYYGSDSYQITAEDLTVFVGEEPPAVYTVTYTQDGEVHKIVQTSGKMLVDAVPSPAPEGYEFLGWEVNGVLYQPGDEFEVTGDVTFTAIWKEIVQTVNYTLTFETDGGTAIEAVTKEEGSVIDLLAYVPTKTGYTFEGWYSDAACTQKVTSVTLNADTTVYAAWEKISSGDTGTSNLPSGGTPLVHTYILSFETNGGSAIESVEKVRNTVVDLSKYLPAREGYTFEGWYKDRELTEKVAKIKITADTIVYAKWAEGESEQEIRPNYKPDILIDDHVAYIVGRSGGYIYPEENLTRAEAATIFFRLLEDEVREEAMTTKNNFADVKEDDWFGTAVSTLANLKIVNGKDADTFAPDDAITRAELTTILARLSEANYAGEDLFKDIAGHWAQNYINIAASIGWVQGENNLFRPDDNMTRAEVMTLINRALNRQPESEEDLLDGMTIWPDNSDENAWYYLAIQEATNSHNYVMKADGIHETWTELIQTPDWTKIEK